MLSVSEFILTTILSLLMSAVFITSIMLIFIFFWSKFNGVWEGAPRETWLLPIVWIGGMIALLTISTTFYYARLGRTWALIVTPMLSIIVPIFIDGSFNAIFNSSDMFLYSEPVELFLTLLIIGGGGISLIGGLLHFRRIHRNAGKHISRIEISVISMLLVMFSRYGTIRKSLIWALILSFIQYLSGVVAFLITCTLSIFIGYFLYQSIFTEDRSLSNENIEMVVILLLTTAYLQIFVAISSILSQIRGRGTVYLNGIFAFISAINFIFVLNYIVDIHRSSMESRNLSEIYLPLTLMEVVPLVSFWLLFAFRGFLIKPFFRSRRRILLSLARGARELAERRKEPPVLFLRAFADDEQYITSRDSAILQALGAPGRRQRLEELVADRLSSLGPVVALQNPAVKATPIGAARDVASHDNWREVVINYIDRAQVIVVFLADTESLAWEIEQVSRAAKAERLILVIPPDYPSRRHVIAVPALAELFNIADARQENELLSGARAIAFDAAQMSYVAFCSTQNDQSAYERALLACLFVLRLGYTEHQPG